MLTWSPVTSPVSVRSPGMGQAGLVYVWVELPVQLAPPLAGAGLVQVRVWVPLNPQAGFLALQALHPPFTGWRGVRVMGLAVLRTLPNWPTAVTRVPVLKVRVKVPVVRGLRERVATVPVPCLPPLSAGAA